MKAMPGRYTASIEGDFVVFVIGMRINKLWKVHKWLPVARAMRPMLMELERHPEKGLLAYRQMFAGRTITLIQYWRSKEQLHRFARDRDDPHLPAWRRFNQRVGTNGDVGIFHESYEVPAGAYTTIYGNMPRIGLASAGEHIAVGRPSIAPEPAAEPAAEPVPA